jgi:hypothetical protein|tara:strand:+ start:7992 stop:8462 length:471 start_codon:yes stop_codon:yes gene_type:complete
MQNIDETSTTKKHPLGTTVMAHDFNSTTDYGEGEFIYLKGVASTAVGSWVTIADNHTTALAVADGVGQVGVAMSANVANQWGWYQIAGQAAGLVLTGFVASGSDAYLTATAGSLDDSAVEGDFVCNAVPVSARDTPSSGLAEFQLARPFVRNLLDV